MQNHCMEGWRPNPQVVQGSAVFDKNRLFVAVCVFEFLGLLGYVFWGMWEFSLCVWKPVDGVGYVCVQESWSICILGLWDCIWVFFGLHMRQLCTWWACVFRYSVCTSGWHIGCTCLFSGPCCVCIYSCESGMWIFRVSKVLSVKI